MSQLTGSDDKRKDELLLLQENFADKLKNTGYLPPSLSSTRAKLIATLYIDSNRNIVLASLTQVDAPHVSHIGPQEYHEIFYTHFVSF